MKTRLTAWPMAVAVRYATRRFLRRVTTSVEVADEWMCVSLLVAVMAGSGENIPLMLIAMASMMAAYSHGKNLKKGE